MIQHFLPCCAASERITRTGRYIFSITAFVMGVWLAQSCISFKSEYPRTTYYRIEQLPCQTAQRFAAEPLTVKPFSIDAEFATDRLLVLNTATEVQSLNYHRWISEPEELLTSALTTRLQRSGFFPKGVFTANSTVLSSLQVEGRVMECVARNAGANPANTATLTIHLTLQRFDPMAAKPVLLQKVYSHTAKRSNDAAASIAPAMSEACAAITDSLLKDLTGLLSPQ